MFCLQCDYDLHGSESERCPECGQEFDPSDPTTYLSMRSPLGMRLLRHRKLSIGAAVVFWLYPAAMLGMQYATWGVAWLSLGYRPQPWIDDPGYISVWVDVFYYLTGALLIFFFPSVPAGCCATLWAGVARRKSAWVITVMALIYLALIVGTIAVLRWDPIRVGDWFMD